MERYIFPFLSNYQFTSKTYCIQAKHGSHTTHMRETLFNDNRYGRLTTSFYHYHHQKWWQGQTGWDQVTWPAM